MSEPQVGSAMLDRQIEADRELLRAVLRRHAATLPTLVLGDLGAAADELVDPLVLPTLMHVDPADTADLLGVVHAVRVRLQHHAQAGVGVAQAMACARAARQLVGVERWLTAGPGR